MSFFTLSDGSNATSEKSFTLSEDFKPIPENTELKVVVEDAAWENYNDEKKIKLTWVVIDGKFKERKIFQKIKVCDEDQKKRDKALKMLAAVDANTGGNLMLAGKEPTDEELQQYLCNHPMFIKVGVWSITDEMTGEIKSGNWIKAVANTESEKKDNLVPEKEEDITF